METTSSSSPSSASRTRSVATRQRNSRRRSRSPSAFLMLQQRGGGGGGEEETPVQSSRGRAAAAAAAAADVASTAADVAAIPTVSRPSRPRQRRHYRAQSYHHDDYDEDGMEPISSASLRRIGLWLMAGCFLFAWDLFYLMGYIERLEQEQAQQPLSVQQVSSTTPHLLMGTETRIRTTSLRGPTTTTTAAAAANVTTTTDSRIINSIDNDVSISHPKQRSPRNQTIGKD